MSDVEDFVRLSKALKNAGRKAERQELHKGLRDAAKRVLPRAQKRLADGLPARLRDRGAKVKQVVQVKTGNDPGVTIAVRYGPRGRGLGASNAQLANRLGQIRHPLYGNRERWFNTAVPGAKDWFDGTYRDSAGEIRRDLAEAQQRVIDKIVREAG